MKTHAIYWGLGGFLITFGLMHRSPLADLAVGTGTLILAVKAREGLTTLSEKAVRN